MYMMLRLHLLKASFKSFPWSLERVWWLGRHAGVLQVQINQRLVNVFLNIENNTFFNQINSKSTTKYKKQCSINIFTISKLSVFFSI